MAKARVIVAEHKRQSPYPSPCVWRACIMGLLIMNIHYPLPSPWRSGGNATTTGGSHLWTIMPKVSEASCCQRFQVYAWCGEISHYYKAVGIWVWPLGVNAPLAFLHNLY